MSAQERVMGRWRACVPPSNFHKGKVFIRPESSELLIATVSGELRLTESIYASRLIAAAPDLLEACQLVIGSLSHTGSPHDYEVMRRVNAAINKAQGR